MPKHENNSDFFPGLNLAALVNHAKEWAGQFSFDVHRIVLYWNKEANDPPYYTLAFEVPGGFGDPTVMAELDPCDFIRFKVGRSFWSTVLRPHCDEGREWWDWLVLVCEPGEEIMEIIRDCHWVIYEREPDAESSPDESLVHTARTLLPTINELWGMILSGGDNPLKLRTPEDLQNVAIDVVSSDPQQWLPITKSHLNDLSLYNPAPEHAVRTFREGLLRAVLVDQGFIVKNVRKLLKLL